MTATDMVVRCAGEAGDGIITLGDIFVKAYVRMGLSVFTFRSYPTEVRGGNVMYQIRVSANQALSQGDKVDILVAFNRKEMESHIDSLAPGGILILDQGIAPPPGRADKALYVPLSQLSQGFGQERRNIVMLGFLARYLGMEEAVVRGIIGGRFAKREELLRHNIGAFKVGWEYCALKAWLYERPLRMVGTAQQRLLMSGNEAMVLGAIAAGCRFFAGYPITPASEILEYMAEVLPRFGGNVLQVEDEMAALASVIGASFVGTKAMTATSGPGFSLMGELIGFASMAEIPCVIVDSQRVGPSTGIPTSTEQSDLLLAIHASHGESPRIVLAPSTVEECFSLTMDAFNLSEAYQLPVIILSDLALSHRLEAVPPFDPSKAMVVDRMTPMAEVDDTFMRFKVTETGVSVMPIPGSSGIYAAMGIEHDEKGFPGYTPEIRLRMTEKRFGKLDHVVTHKFIRTFGDPEAPIGIIGWGSTEGAIIEAVDTLAKEGISVQGLQLKMLCPLPKEELAAFAEGKKAIVVAELNHNGQCASLLKSDMGLETKSIRKYVGLPFTAGELVERLRGVIQVA